MIKTSTLLLVLAACISFANSFVPHLKVQGRVGLVNYFGIDGGGMDLADKDPSTLDQVNVGPDPVEQRDAGQSVLVSGLLKSKERTDQTTFDYLKENFAFTKIIAFCSDTVFAKKRLTSRSSRYSGLLDILEFRQGDGNIPKVADLKDVDSYIAYGITETDVEEIAKNSMEAGIKNLICLMESPKTAKSVKSVMSTLSSASGLSYTLLTVPQIVDGSEGKPYRISKPEDINSFGGSTIARDEVLRLLTETLGIKNTENKGYSVTAPENDEVAENYLKDLRSKGYSRTQEIDKMLSGGISEFESKVVEKKEAESAKIAAEEKKKKEKGSMSKSREEEIKELIEKGKREYKEMMEDKVKTEATDILKREWREKYFARNTSLPEDEYIAENMERGVKDAIRMIKMLKGEKLDEDDLEEHWMDREEREAREQEEKNPEPTEDPESKGEEVEPPATQKTEGGDGEGV